MLVDAVARTALAPAGVPIGVVTAFHLVEHLPFETLVALLDECVRVLHPGGVAILETPDPENLRVGSTGFYLDPTHRNPIPKQTLAFLARARGLARVEVVPLHPGSEADRLPGEGELAARLDALLNGPRDYAIVGWGGA